MKLKAQLNFQFKTAKCIVAALKQKVCKVVEADIKTD